MSIYVDELMDWGMKYRGHFVRTCHMVTDGDIEELHNMATQLGLRKYFQDHPTHPHYDLMSSKRAEAVKLGAIEVTAKELIDTIRSKQMSDPIEPEETEVDASVINALMAGLAMVWNVPVQIVQIVTGHIDTEEFEEQE